MFRFHSVLFNYFNIDHASNRYSKKPKFVIKPKFQEVEEGQEVVIDSEIVGDPLPKITWLRDGLKVGFVIFMFPKLQVTIQLLFILLLS